MRLKCILTLFLAVLVHARGSAQDWQSLWKSYNAGFMDNQVRVIDHTEGERTTSEGQAYAMFFSLVANDQARFDGLLHWTEQNLADGDLSTHLPAWLWGRKSNNEWGVVDSNSASDADLWMAYTLLEAGKAWNDARYTKLGSDLAHMIAMREVGQVPGLGVTLLPAATGFRPEETHSNSYRLNASYLPLQVVLGVGHLAPGGPWQKVADSIPALVRDSAPHGFASDWIDFKTDGDPQPSPVCSYDAIRVYLWAGMLDAKTPGRDAILDSLPGMANYLRTNSVPPAKVGLDGSVQDPKGPPGFSAVLIPYAAALGDNQLRDQQLSRVQSSQNSQTGLLGNPPRYYDQNLALFALGWMQHEFSFDSEGALQLKWKNN